MTLAQLLGLVVVAGIVGGAANAFMSKEFFLLPRKEETSEGSVWRTGFLGNMLLGGLASFLSYALYNPDAIGITIGEPPPAPGTAPKTYGIPLPQVGAAIVVGIGGARWLTNEVDKRLLRETNQELASKQANPEARESLRDATPAEALKIARDL